MSQRYTVGCSTPVPHTCVFLSPCSVPWSSTPSPEPAKFPSPTQFSFPHPCQTPLVCWYFLPDTQSSPFAPIPALPPPGEISCFLLPKIGILSSVCLSSCPFLLTCATSVNVFCNPFSCSARRAMPSANLKSPILSPPMSAPSFDLSSAIAIIIFRNMLNSKGDKTHPCSTPITVSNYSDSSPFTRTALKVSLYAFSSILTIFSGYP